MMFDEADAFVALPGGFGTLEELFEMVRNKIFISFLFHSLFPSTSTDKSSTLSNSSCTSFPPPPPLTLSLSSDHLAAARLPHQARRRPQLFRLLRQAPQLLRRRGLVGLCGSGVEGDRRRRSECGGLAGRARGAQAAAARDPAELDAFDVRGGHELRLRLCGDSFQSLLRFFLPLLCKKPSFFPLFFSLSFHRFRSSKRQKRARRHG